MGRRQAPGIKDRFIPSTSPLVHSECHRLRAPNQGAGHSKLRAGANKGTESRSDREVAREN
ncbi:hypothetical protein SAMN05444166_5721 [Singulisphaera sp. GP187]|nr:hypothetical protein SAMN05444166_5721 [Singulisphaera sp. GP187]